MGLLEQEIKELRELNALFIAGKVEAEHVNTRINIYSQTEKRARLMLTALALSSRSGPADRLDRVISTALIGDNGSAIDVKVLTQDEIENELVKCVANQKRIPRHKCLDYSGSKKYKKCEGCLIGLATKNILLGEK